MCNRLQQICVPTRGPSRHHCYGISAFSRASFQVRARVSKRSKPQRQYIDSNAANATQELQKQGGAQVILAAAPSSKAMSALVDGLAPNGKLIVVGATFDPIEVTPIQLISGSRALQGRSTGTPADSEDTLRFSELTGVRAMIESHPLEKAGESYARMISGKAESESF